MNQLRKCAREACSTQTYNAKYCGRRCAVIVNNTAYPKRRGAVTDCTHCGNEFRRIPSSRRSTCSPECLRASQYNKRVYESKWTPESLFIDSADISRQEVKTWLLRWKIMELKCSNCGITEWMGEPAPIDLDHINGQRHDHRLENLRMLCANCHRQTPTHGWKNARRLRTMVDGVTGNTTGPDPVE